MTIIRPPVIRSLTDPRARAGLAGDSPETGRSTSDRRSEVLRRVSGGATARLAPRQQKWAGKVAVGEEPIWPPTSDIQQRTLNLEPRTLNPRTAVQTTKYTICGKTRRTA